MKTSARPTFVLLPLLLAACSSNLSANLQGTASSVPSTAQQAPVPAPTVQAPVPAPTQPVPSNPYPFAAQVVPGDLSPIAADTQQPSGVITIQNGVFSHNSLLARVGQKIVLQLHAADNTYGFNMPDLGIQLTVPQGQTVSVPLPTDKTGSFKFWDHLHPESGDWTTWKTRGVFTVQAQ